jgi:hypothetical protein
MWTTRYLPTEDRRTVRFAIDRDSTPAGYDEVIRGWREDDGFRSFFTTLLASSTSTAFRWETPPITAATAANTPFEFVLVDDPPLDRKPDPRAFESHLSNATESVVVFPNLGGDAVMVVPCPLASPNAYGHLAAFVRHAPVVQQHALWQVVGEAMQQRLGHTPVWLSTSGAGVPWLHVRLDDRPKYYYHKPYRTAA